MKILSLNCQGKTHIANNIKKLYNDIDIILFQEYNHKNHKNSIEPDESLSVHDSDYLSKLLKRQQDFTFRTSTRKRIIIDANGNKIKTQKSNINRFANYMKKIKNSLMNKKILSKVNNTFYLTWHGYNKLTSKFVATKGLCSIFNKKYKDIKTGIIDNPKDSLRRRYLVSQINYKQTIINIINVHNEHYQNGIEMLEYLINYCEQRKKQYNENYIICGDMNIDLKPYIKDFDNSKINTTDNCCSLNDIIDYDVNLLHLNTNTHQKGNCIDWAVTNMNVEGTIERLEHKSDHFAVMYDIKLN